MAQDGTGTEVLFAVPFELIGSSETIGGSQTFGNLVIAAGTVVTINDGALLTVISASSMVGRTR